MRVFISWSGGPSRELALALRNWLPKVLRSVDPFVSAKDIDKGANWTTVLDQELTDTNFGIVCVTPENLRSPWLHYEAGAIAKSVSARVCPVLLSVKTDQLDAPLSQLQVTELTEPDIGLLALSLNKASEVTLPPSHVEEAVSVWYPQLREAVEKIDAGEVGAAPVAAEEPAKPRSTEKEMLEEVLLRMRRIERALPGVSLEKVPADLVERRMLEDLFIGARSPRFRKSKGGSWEVLLDEVSKPDRADDVAALAAIAKRSGRPVWITDGKVSFDVDADGVVSEMPF